MRSASSSRRARADSLKLRIGQRTYFSGFPQGAKVRTLSGRFGAANGGLGERKGEKARGLVR